MPRNWDFDACTIFLCFLTLSSSTCRVAIAAWATLLRFIRDQTIPDQTNHSRFGRTDLTTKRGWRLLLSSGYKSTLIHSRQGKPVGAFQNPAKSTDLVLTPFETKQQLSISMRIVKQSPHTASSPPYSSSKTGQPSRTSYSPPKQQSPPTPNP